MGLTQPLIDVGHPPCSGPAGNEEGPYASPPDLGRHGDRGCQVRDRPHTMARHGAVEARWRRAHVGSISLVEAPDPEEQDKEDLSTSQRRRRPSEQLADHVERAIRVKIREGNRLAGGLS